MHMNHPDLYGSAVWADPFDIADRFPYVEGECFWLGRNPYNFNDMIGVKDDRHVFMCAGSRGGKGRSITLPNLLTWKGSLVSVDPKGENASVAAPRRANGDDFCDGLKQETFVLDPYDMARVPDALRASCNLMDTLDPNSKSLLSESESFAQAMRVAQDGGESESWSKEGAEITALVIAHVKSYKGFEDHLRNLVTVRELLCTGQRSGWLKVKEINKQRIANAEKANEGKDPKDHIEPKLIPDLSPFELLYLDMQDNPAQGGAIARQATALLDLMRGNVRQYNSLIQNARSETRFMDDLQMVASQTGGHGNGRMLDISRLKTDENGISVFICLPDKPDHPAIRWQKALLTLILDRMAEDQNEPATGQEVLMSLDEFQNMGKMDRIAKGMDSIGGAGVRLFISVTQIGTLKDLYGESWEQFPSNSGIKIWFQVDGPAGKKYLEQECGEAQVELVTRSESQAFSIQVGQSESFADSESISESEAEGRSTGKTDGSSLGRTLGHNMSMTVTDAENFSRATGEAKADTEGTSSSWQISNGFSHGRQDSRSNGHSSGRSHNDWVFFKPLTKSTNEGRNTQSTRGTNSAVSKNDSRGGGRNKSRTITQNVTDTVGGSVSKAATEGRSDSETRTQHSSTTETLSKTYTKGRTRGRTQTRGESLTKGETRTVGTQTTIQKRPLLTVTEINRYLNRVKEREDPAYPGFALVLISGEEPFLVRKCHYDEDPMFEQKFTPHYRYRDAYLPYSKQRLVGGQYTAEHFVPVRLPKAVQDLDEAIDVTLRVDTDTWFEKGDILFEWTGPTLNANKARLNKASAPLFTHGLEALPYEENKGMRVIERAGDAVRQTVKVKAPAAGKVIDYALNPAFEQDGDIVLLRFERALSSENREQFERYAFQQLTGYATELESAQIALDKRVSEFNEERAAQWQKIQARKKREADEAEYISQQEEARIKREKDEKARLAAERYAAREEERKAEAKTEKTKETIRNILIGGFIVSVIIIQGLTRGG